MNRAQVKTKGLMRRAVNEAIDAFAAPDVRDFLINLALRRAKEKEIPDDAAPLAAFLQSALYPTLEQSLGKPAADAVRQELTKAAFMLDEKTESAMAGKNERRREETKPAPADERAKRDTAPAPKDVPRLLIATVDPTGVQQLCTLLAGVALVEPVVDAVDILEHATVETPLVVLDCRSPAIRAQTLMTIQPELPEKMRIVLWGDRPSLENELRSIGAAIPPNWIRCGTDATAEDVAAVVRVLLG
jgi:hypothetical protein